MWRILYELTSTFYLKRINLQLIYVKYSVHSHSQRTIHRMQLSYTHTHSYTHTYTHSQKICGKYLLSFKRIIQSICEEYSQNLFDRIDRIYLKDAQDRIWEFNNSHRIERFPFSQSCPYKCCESFHCCELVLEIRIKRIFFFLKSSELDSVLHGSVSFFFF